MPDDNNWDPHKKKQQFSSGIPESVPDNVPSHQPGKNPVGAGIVPGLFL